MDGPTNNQIESREPVDSRKLHINPWKVYFAFVLTILILILGYRITLKNQIPLPTPTQSPSRPVSTIHPVKAQLSPTPGVKRITKKPVSGTSLGIFYPYNQGMIINNNLPTIIGKIPQTENLHLPIKFDLETSPVSQKDEYFLRFLPGEISELTIKIDDQKIEKVYGIAQYPTLPCNTNTANSNDQLSIDGDINIDSCFKYNQSNIPPLIFFAKPKIPLSTGSHIISVSGPEYKSTMSFAVQEQYHASSQSVFTVDTNEPNPHPLIQGDSCPPGYYYDKDHIRIPLPRFSNQVLLYTLSFPQTAIEQGILKDRQVQISFGKDQFDLFFPENNIFHKNESMISGTPNYQNPYHELFLPINLLVYPNGQKAYYSKNFFEIHPVDITGGTFENLFILRQINTSSACDD